MQVSRQASAVVVDAETRKLTIHPEIDLCGGCPPVFLNVCDQLPYGLEREHFEVVAQGPRRIYRSDFECDTRSRLDFVGKPFYRRHQAELGEHGRADPSCR